MRSMKTLFAAAAPVIALGFAASGCEETGSGSAPAAASSVGARAPATTSAAVGSGDPRCSYAPMPFPGLLSPDMPYDVDTDRKKELESQGKFGEVQRLFDIFSWQTFIALNWPSDKGGNPDRGKSLGDKGRRVWETWREAFEVYRANGETPVPWGAPTRLPDPSGLEGDRILHPLHTTNRARATVGDETLQAFKGPLVDQNGKWVRYEIVIDKEEYDYVNNNKLYYVQGQIAFSNDRKVVSFPSGSKKSKTAPEDRRGAMEVKLAWKEMGPKDIKSRFYTVDAWIESDTDKWERRQMGLVGMHIAVRTVSSPQWIWATFEHVDNVQVNPLEVVVGNDGQPTSLTPSFFNPSLEHAADPVNVEPPSTSCVADPCSTGTTGPCKGQTPIWDPRKTTTPAQVVRVIPIPGDKRMLNCEVQHLLKGTPFQYYELIDTQWPTDPGAPAVAGGPNTAPGSVVNKAPGHMTPVFLTNTMMESYFQAGNQAAGGQEEPQSSDTTKVFATESCTGCHYSAGIAASATASLSKAGVQCAQPGPTGSGNFSWLMQQKAQFKPEGAPAK